MKPLKTAAAPSEAYPYDRALDLPPLIKLWPWELEETSIEASEKIVIALHRALRGERRRRANNHWSYDMNKHHALLKAYKAERTALDTKRRSYIASRHLNTQVKSID